MRGNGKVTARGSLFVNQARKRAYTFTEVEIRSPGQGGGAIFGIGDLLGVRVEPEDALSLRFVATLRGVDDRGLPVEREIPCRLVMEEEFHAS